MTVDDQRIFHYTSIESLALILKSRKLRFTRMDRVDDVREAQSHYGIKFGNYLFVSCWTKDSEESIPQWHMYSRKMSGVRIELPDYPFNKKPLKSSWSWLVIADGAVAPLSIEEMYTPSYHVNPACAFPNLFAGPVEYVSDVVSPYATAIAQTSAPDGRSQVQIKNMFNLPRLKSKAWEFQKEYRFVLFALPSKPIPLDKHSAEQFCNELMDYQMSAFLSGATLDIGHIDVDLDLDALNKLIVRVGPHCTAGSKQCVEALLKEFAPKARIEVSNLSGTIRNRAG